MDSPANTTIGVQSGRARWSWPIGLLAIFAVLVLRHPDVIVNAQLTWEDGRIFLTEALSRPWYSTWFSPFIGYFIVLPKMVASLFTPVTMLHAPLVFNLFSLCLMAGVLALPLSGAFAHLGRWPERALWVASCALMPWWTETFGNITNVHWYLYFALTLFTLASLTAVPGWMKVLLPFALVLCVFTTPNCVAIVPVLAVRLYADRRSRSYQFYIHLFALVVIVGMVAARAAVVGPVVPAESLDLAGILLMIGKGLGYKVVVLNVAGGLGARVLQHAAIVVIAAAGFAALTLMLLRHARRTADAGLERTVAAAVYYILASIVMCAVLRPQYVVHFVRVGDYWGADRYFVIPSFYFLLLLVMAASRLRRVYERRRMDVAGMVLYTAILIMNFHYPAIPDYQWRRQVQAYYLRLLENPQNRPGGTFPILTFPGEPWAVQAPLYTPSASERQKLQRLTVDLAR